ncbi:AarF/UbiB family protein [Gulosibacter chungangensis]|uniref:AarF/ABC1/UbiB kinase family protein n=1 Tax=Gulosibacter chungangensis TaxID=979746 RepID=A0A7J5B9C8_9MICO|nr:AarF/UbiB family protein [Gulosibacter chungangensis]KAB1642143.1 AarF/ABC1/UbiB kinase family protein [Gulosibacter chungangensis]
MSALTVSLDIVLMLVAALVFMLLIGSLLQRLLGKRMSRARITFAGLLGLIAGVAFAARFAWNNTTDRFAMIAIALSLILFVSVATLVLAELVLPQGSLPRPDKWLPAVRRGVQRQRRYQQLARIIGKHKVLPRALHHDNTVQAMTARREQADALRAVLEDAGGAFVKIGQILSTRPDLLPQEFITALGKLQQQVPPASWETIEPALNASLGRDYREVFQSFHTEPFASASIGQVYDATLHSGERVAVKVRRPGIVDRINLDTDIALRLARTFTQNSEWGDQLHAEHLVQNLTDSLKEEVDYRCEAANLAVLAHAQTEVAESARVRIPRQYPELSTDEVFVMEYLEGTTLSHISSLESLDAAKRHELARRLLASTLEQIVDVGAYHSDLHPGNIVIDTEQQLALLDFGAVGRLDSQMRQQILDVLLAYTRHDSRAFTEAILGFLDLPDDLDEASLRRSLADFMATKLGVGTKLDASIVTDVTHLLQSYGLVVPAQMTMPFRAIIAVEGSLTVLDPSFNFLAEVASFVKHRAVDAVKPASVTKALADEALGALPMIRRLPGRVDRITGDLAEGRFGFNMRLLADRRDRDFIREIVATVTFAVLAGVTGIMSVLLLNSTTGPALSPEVTLLNLFGYLLLSISGVLSLRVLFDVLRRRGRGIH